MKFNFPVKIICVCLLISTGFGCQNKSASDADDSIVQTNKNKQPPNQSNAMSNQLTPQRVTFESADKVQIVGTFYGSPRPDSPAILMLHQWQSNRKLYDNFASRLQKQGFGVLAIDGRGFGESVKTTDGKPVVPSRTSETVEGMKADVANAFDFLARQKNVNAEQIGIVGASYGSSLAIIYAAENRAVKLVALLSPGLNYFGNMPTESAVKNYGNRPLLLIAAEDDEESANAVRKLKESGASDQYEVKIYPKGGHGTGIFEAKVGLEDLLEAFLKKSLA